MPTPDPRGVRAWRSLVEIARDHGIELVSKGRDAWASCPFHQEKTPSFVIYGDNHFHCYGCGAHGDVITFVMRIDGLGFRLAIEQLRRFPISDVNQFAGTSGSAPGLLAERSKGTRFARAIWSVSVAVQGTLGEKYLRRARQVAIAIPPSIRFHPSLEHRPSGSRFPALVLGIQAPDDKLQGVQRIFLRPDGLQKAAVDRSKMSLGSVKGGALRLAAAQPRLGLAEGPETGLSVMQLTNTPVWVTCGGANLSTVELPREVKEVVLYGDNGERGHAFVDRAARHFHLLGLKVRIAFPPPEFGDFNDLLLGRSAKQARAA